MSEGNVNDVCNSSTYLNELDQRRQKNALNQPPPRYDNLAANPYAPNPITGLFFTPYQISMRRKAEILSFPSSKSSTQTNNLTRAQKWAQLVKQRQISKSFLDNYENNSGQIQLPECPPTPSTSCGVPGPLVYLSKDKTVPLYNYLNNVTTAPYSIQVQPENTNIFEYYSTIDNYCPTSPPTNYQYSPCSTLHIISPINDRYTFSMSIPISVYIEADVSYNGTLVQYTDLSAVSVWLSSSDVRFMYSTSAAMIQSTPVYTLNSIYNSSNPLTIATNQMTIYPKSNIQSQNPEKNRFFTYAYLGTLDISNIVLPCQKDYIYTIQLALNFNSRISGSYITYFGDSNPTIAAYVNTSFATTQLPPQHCTIHPPPTEFIESEMPVFSLSAF